MTCMKAIRHENSTWSKEMRICTCMYTDIFDKKKYGYVHKFIYFDSYHCIGIYKFQLAWSKSKKRNKIDFTAGMTSWYMLVSAVFWKKGTKNPFSILNFFNIFDGKYFSHEILLHILNIHKKFHLLLGDAWKSYQQESFEHTNYYYYYFSILFFLFNKFMNIPIQFAIKIWIYDLRGIWMWISMRFSSFSSDWKRVKDMNMWNCSFM